MRAVRDRQLISGFCLEGVVRGVPGLTHCGEAWCSSRHRLESHTHSGFEFVYVTRGQASWRVGEQLITQKMGDLLITYPQEAHATGGGHGGDFQLLWVGLDLARMGHEGRRLLRELTRERHVLLAGCHEIEGALRGAFSQLAGNLPHKERVAAHYLRTFVRLVEQRLALARTTSLPPPLLPYSPATQRALAFMQSTLDRRATVAELTAVANSGRSGARFAARFQREVGVSPGAYHLRLRLDAARQALRATDANITQVALRYGFSSSQHFSAAFRAAFRVTPRRWRLAPGEKHLPSLGNAPPSTRQHQARRMRDETVTPARE